MATKLKEDPAEGPTPTTVQDGQDRPVGVNCRTVVPVRAQTRNPAPPHSYAPGPTGGGHRIDP